MATASHQIPPSDHVLLPLRRQNGPNSASRKKPAKYLRVTEQDRRFVAMMAADPALDAIAAARACGWKLDRRPNRAYAIQRRLQHLIDQQVLGREDSEQMELDEALEVTAGLARSEEDGRVRLGAVRTILEIHGVLGSKAGGDGKEVRKTLDALVSAIKQKLSEAGKGARVRVRQAVQVEIEQEPEMPETPETPKTPFEVVDKGQKRLLE